MKEIFHDRLRAGAYAAGPGICDRGGETRPGLSPRGAALAGGMVNKIDKK